MSVDFRIDFRYVPRSVEICLVIKCLTGIDSCWRNYQVRRVLKDS